MNRVKAKKRKTLVALVVLFVIGSILFFLIRFLGAPWEHIKAANVAKAYIAEEYGETVQYVSSTRFWQNRYTVTLLAQGKQNFSFIVILNLEYKVIEDNYYQRWVQNELDVQMESIAKNNYPNSIPNVNFVWMTEEQKQGFYQQGLGGQFSLEKAKPYISNNIGVVLNSAKAIDVHNYSDEIDDLYRLVLQINEWDYQVYRVSIFWNKSKTKLVLNNEDLLKISTPENLLPYFTFNN